MSLSKSFCCCCSGVSSCCMMVLRCKWDVNKLVADARDVFRSLRSLLLFFFAPGRGISTVFRHVCSPSRQCFCQRCSSCPVAWHRGHTAELGADFGPCLASIKWKLSCMKLRASANNKAHDSESHWSLVRT